MFVIFVIFASRAFNRRNFRFEHVDDAVRLPYIGGARGQVLEIRQRPDGTIFSRILMDDAKTEEPDVVEQPTTVSFEDSLAEIQRAAAELVTLQQAYKQNGELSANQRRKYSESLEKLGISAQKLANIQGEDDYKILLEGKTRLSSCNEKFLIYNIIQSILKVIIIRRRDQNKSQKI